MRVSFWHEFRSKKQMNRLLDVKDCMKYFGRPPTVYLGESHVLFVSCFLPTAFILLVFLLHDLSAISKFAHVQKKFFISGWVKRSAIKEWIISKCIKYLVHTNSKFAHVQNVKGSMITKYVLSKNELSVKCIYSWTYKLVSFLSRPEWLVFKIWRISFSYSFFYS